MISIANLEIKISTHKLKHYSKSAGFKVDEDTLLVIIELFSNYMKRLYKESLEEAMNDRRYKGQWEPRNEKGYQEYLGTTPSDIPIIDLIDEALEVKKIGYNFIIRVSSRYKYPGSSKSLLQVLRAIEGGTADFNARPIIKKVVRELEGDIRSLWKGYLILGGAIE